MKLPLLLLLVAPLCATAQYRPMYTPTYRPSYTPPPVRPGPSPMQQQQAQQQLAHQNFQRMQAQQMQQMQMQQFYSQQQHSLRQQQYQQQLLLRRPLSAEELAQRQARQQQAEAKATDSLSRLAARLHAQRLAHPAADAQQAEAQQRQDARTLTTAAVRAYQEVFLPGQVFAAMQARVLPPESQARWQHVGQEVHDNAWWQQADAAQRGPQLVAHARTLTALTTDLLGFDPASPPPAPAPASAAPLDAQLATDAFDPATAQQLLRDAAQAEKRLEGERLGQAVLAFQALAAQPPAADPKAWRRAVQHSLTTVDRELQRYYLHAGSSRRLYQAQKDIRASTDAYLAKSAQ